MLPCDAERFSTAEITHFASCEHPQAPRRAARAAPFGFRLTLKVPRRSTHDGGSRDPATARGYRLETASHTGALLFQPPPDRSAAIWRCSRDFSFFLPQGVRAVFELSHASWLSDVCTHASPTARKPPTRIELTVSSWLLAPARSGYRAHLAVGKHDPAAHVKVRSRARVLQAEEGGKGPVFARWLLDALEDGI